jgi:hypothetical protein
MAGSAERITTQLGRFEAMSDTKLESASKVRPFGKHLVIIAVSAVLMSLGAWAQSAQSEFVGKWSGSWGGVNASTLDVTSVTEAGIARGVYTFRDASWKFIAKISNGALSWGEPVGGIGFEFTLLPNGKLHGERYDHGGQAGDVIMTKM